MAYIKSGTMSKALLAHQPKPLYQEAQALNEEADRLEKDLEDLRTPKHGYGIRHLKGDDHVKAWDLRMRLGELDKRIDSLRRKNDPEWFKYWGV